MKTLFQKIIDKELPSETLYEDDEIICIHDKFPQAPVHILLITKKPIISIDFLSAKDGHLLVKIFAKAKELAEFYGIKDSYRILTNHGDKAGQTVPHLHFHLLGGKVLAGKGG
ncbi:MAG: Purine nucleoside phosphoramidase [Chlamydiia bacterium]|nr:Purine nucleoside phosphoramidase [Chlamydiia bacterium]